MGLFSRKARTSTRIEPRTFSFHHHPILGTNLTGTMTLSDARLPFDERRLLEMIDRLEGVFSASIRLPGWPPKHGRRHSVAASYRHGRNLKECHDEKRSANPKESLGLARQIKRSVVGVDEGACLIPRAGTTRGSRSDD